MRNLGLVAAFMIFSTIGYAITVNPASNVTADSANTAETIVLRDASGNFSAGTITATIMGSISSIAGTVAISTSATSANAFNIKGHYSSTEIGLLSGKLGDVVFNSTVGTICVGTGATTTNGAYVYISSSAASEKVVCGK